MGAFLLVFGVCEPVTAVTRQEPCPVVFFGPLCGACGCFPLWDAPPPLPQLVSTHNFYEQSIHSRANLVYALVRRSVVRYKVA